MSYGHTFQDNWKILNQATVSVANAAMLALASDYVKTELFLAYGTAWTGSSVPLPAQNPAYRPPVAVKLSLKCNQVRLRFAVADSNNDKVTGNLWGWDAGMGGIELLRLNPIQAGNIPIAKTPEGDALTNFFLADTVTVTGDNCGYTKRVITESNDEMVELADIDTQGLTWLFFDFDTDAAATAGTDGIVFYKEM